MRWVLVLIAVTLAGCGQEAAEAPKKADAKPEGFIVQEVSGNEYIFNLPTNWVPYQLNDAQFEESLKSASIGKNPEAVRAALRKARESGVTRFMAFLKIETKEFTPIMTVTVIPSKTADLNVHFNSATKRVQTLGRIIDARIVDAAKAIYLEAEIMAGEPKRPVRSVSLIRADDKHAVTLNYSYLPSQEREVKPAIDLGWKSFKLK
jgi:hypothetical protein